MQAKGRAQRGWSRRIVWVLCALWGASGWSQPALQGSPPVARFAPALDVYPQNFDVVQDSRGLVYVAGADGVLVFDGEDWQLLPLPSREFVRSLAVGRDDRVYVGSYNSFGYLERDVHGRLHYVELSTRFAAWLAGREFADIWDTVVAPDGVYFRALRDVFFWRDGAPPLAWHHEGRFGAVAVESGSGRTLLQFRGEGFRERQGDAWVPLPATRGAVDLVDQLVPLPEGGWLMSGVQPAWSRLTPDRRIEALEMPTDLPPATLAERVSTLSDGSLVFAGRNGVVQVVAADRRSHRSFRLDSGFLSGIQPLPGGFLASSDQALYRVAWPSEWTVLGAEHGVEGTLTRLAEWNGAYFLLGSAGIFRLIPQPGGLPQIERTSWVNAPTDDLLGIDARRALLTSPHKLLLLEDGRVRELSAELVYPRRLQASRFWPGRVWIGTENGLRHLDGITGPTPVLSPAPELGVDALASSLVERSRNQIWFGTERHGVWRVLVADDGQPGRAERIDLRPDSGLVLGAIQEARVAAWSDGGLVVATRAGLFRLDDATGRFRPDAMDGLASLRPAEQALTLDIGPDGTRWAHGLSRLFRQRRGEVWQEVPIQSLRRGALASHRFEADGRAVFVDSQALLLQQSAAAAPVAEVAPQVQLRDITLIEVDGAERPLPLEPAALPVFVQGGFGIRFRFSLPELATASGMRYRGRLLGYEPEFSAWSAAHAYTYSRLSPGDYKLEVEARDSVGRISAIRPWPLRIEPPWFRRPWVVWLAVLTGMVVLWRGLRWQVRRRLRRLQAERQRLEQTVQQRTSDLAAANARLEQMAHVDGLTGIANRRRLDAELARAWAQAIERGRCLAVLAIDVDHFKRYNDSHGHLAGDELLRRLAQTLCHVLRRSEDLLARYGGEEFLALLPGASLEQSREVAESMRVAVGEGGLGVTVSIGIAVRCPRGGADGTPMELLAAADAALYAAKRGGRDRIEVAPDAPAGSASPA